MDNFQGFKAPVEEIITNVVETAREPESNVDPEDVTELLQPRDKTSMNEELLFFMDEERKWFLERKPPSGKDAVNIVGLTPILKEVWWVNGIKQHHM